MDLNKIKEILNNRPRSNSSREEGGNYKWFKIPPSGDLKVRFLPPTPQSGVPGKIVYKHYNMPEKGSVNCARTWKLECPICKVLEELRYKYDEQTLDQYKSLARAYHNVLLLGGVRDPNTNVTIDAFTPYILASSEFNFYWLLEQISNPDVGDITDPRTGSSVLFKRTRTGGPLERIVARAPSPIADSDEKMEEILAGLPELDNIWKHPDDKYFSSLEVLAEALNTQITNNSEMLKNTGSPNGTATNAPDLRSASGGVFPNPATVAAVHADDEKPAAKPPVAPPVSTSKPKEAPECFGHHADDQEKCSLCIHELDCQEVKS